MTIACTPENFRAEMARHRLSREAVCSTIGLHPNGFSNFVNGHRPLAAWAAHNLGWGFNTATGMMIFNVDMDLGPVRAPKGRPSGFRKSVARHRHRKQRHVFAPY